MRWGRKLGAFSVLSLAMSGAPIALSLAGGGASRVHEYIFRGT